MQNIMKGITHYRAAAGAGIARFQPQGMARALFATAFAQACVAAGAMIAWQQYIELSVLNGFFIALWVGSALLFRRASAPACAGTDRYRDGMKS